MPGLADLLAAKGNKGKPKKLLPVPAAGARAEIHDRLHALEAWAKSIDAAQEYDEALGDFRPIGARAPVAGVDHLDAIEMEGGQMDLMRTTELPEGEDDLFGDRIASKKKKKAPSSPKKASSRPKSPPRTPTKKKASSSSCPQYHNDAVGCRANASCEYRKDGKCRKKTVRSPKKRVASPKRPSTALPPLVPLAAAHPISKAPAGVPVVQAQTLSDAALVQAMPLEGIYAPPKAPARAYKPGSAAYKRYMSGKRK